MRPTHCRVWADHGKWPSKLNPDRAADWAVLRELADNTDIFLSELPPGHLERRGLDPVTFHARAPDGVHVWLPAFGAAGRWSQLPYDPLLLAAVSGYSDFYPSDLDHPIATVVPTIGYLHGVPWRQPPRSPGWWAVNASGTGAQ